MIRLALNEKIYQIKVDKLHRRFFYQGGNNMHRHNVFHFILISQGECQLLRPGNQPVKCPNHSLVLINPGYEHDFRTNMAGVEHSCLICSLHDESGEPLLLPLEQLFDGARLSQPYRINCLNEGEAGEFIGLLTKAIALGRSDKNSDAFAWALGELFMLAVRLCLPECFATSLSGRHEQIAEQIRVVVEQELKHVDFSLEQLSRQLNMHANHLNAIFREVEHMSIGEYLIQRRLQRACQMLAAGQRSKDIADLCGFSSQNYFSRLFRQRIGCSPTSFQAGQPPVTVS